MRFVVQEPGEAVELYLERTGTELAVRLAQPLPVRELPRHCELEEGEERVQLAFYYEILDEDRRLLFRGTGSDPTGATVEFPTPGEAGGRRIGALGRMRTSSEQSHFTLIVPRLPGATHIRLYSLEFSRDLRGGSDPREPIAEIDLRGVG